MVANIVMILGIVMLALPIGLLGTRFVNLYDQRLQLDWRKAAKVLDIDGLDEEGMVALFNQFDESGDGLISRKEFLKVFEKAGLDNLEEMLRALFDKVDGDSSGGISLPEFIEMCKQVQLAKHGLSRSIIEAEQDASHEPASQEPASEEQGKGADFSSVELSRCSGSSSAATAPTDRPPMASGPQRASPRYSMLSRSASDGHEEKSAGVNPVGIVHSHQNALELFRTGDGNSGSERHVFGENNGGCGSGGRVGGAPLRGGDPERSLSTSKDDAVLEATAVAIKRRLLPLVRRGLREMLAVLEEEEEEEEVRAGYSECDENCDDDCDRLRIHAGPVPRPAPDSWPGDADQHPFYDEAVHAGNRTHDRDDDDAAAVKSEPAMPLMGGDDSDAPLPSRMVARNSRDSNPTNVI